MQTGFFERDGDVNSIQGPPTIIQRCTLNSAMINAGGSVDIGVWKHCSFIEEQDLRVPSLRNSYEFLLVFLRS